MKKRNILVSLLLALALMITACGEANPFVGTWRGTCDLTDYILQTVVGEDETIAEFVEFEDLTFVINFEFTETELSMSVDEASLEDFVAHFEAGMISMMEKAMQEQFADADMSYEEMIVETGMTSEEYMKSLLHEMEMDVMMNAMAVDLAKALALDGHYTYSDGVLTVTYEDNTYEEMQYTVKGNEMVITVSDGNTNFDIDCVKQ